MGTVKNTPPAFWFGRQFALAELDPGTFPNILERLIGGPLRLEHLIASIPSSFYTEKWQDRWSIQEQVGHLLTLEPLWYGRIDDIMAGQEVMRAADLENRATDAGAFNARSMEDLLKAFREARESLNHRLWSLSTEDVVRNAKHPRLLQPMRILDLAFFVAEHDDHHLAYIRFLHRQLSGT